MIDLILIILLIISISKPDILLSKKLKEKANDEQKNILARNFRKSYAILIAFFETFALTRYFEGFLDIVLYIFIIVEIILFFTISLPAIKENKKIVKELNQ